MCSHRCPAVFFSGWVYTCFLRNLSQFVALYSLVMFYHGAVKLLQPLKPLQKFLSIKLIIFFTFWQKLVLVGLKHYEMLPVGNLYQDQYMNSSHVTGHDAAAARSAASRACTRSSRRPSTTHASSAPPTIAHSRAGTRSRSPAQPVAWQ